MTLSETLWHSQCRTRTCADSAFATNSTCTISALIGRRANNYSLRKTKDGRQPAVAFYEAFESAGESIHNREVSLMIGEHA